MKDNIYLGDIHGNFNKLLGWVHHNKHRENCNIIQVGDFGIGFKPNFEHHELKNISKKLKNKNHTVLVIRGNHDNPEYFDGNHDYDNIKFLPDYTTMNLNGYNHLFVGGAVSIDRKLRQEGISYWKDEIFIYDEEKLKNINEIDVLVTHTCMSFNKPTFFNNLVYSYAMKDDTLIEELDKERNFVDLMWKQLNENGNKIKLHLYGHFHFDNTEYINDTKHILLDIGEFYEEYN
jgi:UDP-2,3-diacylglucosamine pyrophosphatase LpxH